MKNILIIFLLITFVCACGDVKKETFVCNLLGNTNALSKPTDRNFSRASTRKIQGAWTNGASNDTTFAIKAKIMYFKDHYANYGYALNNDSIKIHYFDCDYKAKIYFYKDTLITESENGIAKFWRFTK